MWSKGESLQLLAKVTENHIITMPHAFDELQFFDTAFSGQLCEVPEGDHATKLMIDAMREPIKQKFFEAVKELDVGQKYLQELDPKFKISDRSSQLGRGNIFAFLQDPSFYKKHGFEIEI
ncbi:MAG: hypothetical protein HON55_04025 [Legionellales bacterium]|jgi:hypothetical protein|nr:hypothetical protein [Legionellales bacterium]